jgi:TolA-binding protein
MATTADTTPTPDAPSSTSGFDLGGEGDSFLNPQRLRMIGIGALVVAVLGGGIWFVNSAGKRKEAFAAQALENARNMAEQGNIGQAVQEFEKVTAQYGGTGAANEATLGIAQARLVAGQAELAIASLQDYLATNPSATYASPANGLLGTALENTGKYAEAEAAYRKAAELAGIEYLKATLMLDAARAARLAGRSAEARALYEEIVERYGETAARTEAEVRLGEMAAGA